MCTLWNRQPGPQTGKFMVELDIHQGTRNPPAATAPTLCFYLIFCT
jgi:hypothetical protein